MAKLADHGSFGAANLQNATRSAPKWLLTAAVVVLVLIGVFAAAAPTLSFMARSRIQTTLQDGFASDLQIKNLKVSLFPSVAISADSLVFQRKGHPDDPPLIRI